MKSNRNVTRRKFIATTAATAAASYLARPGMSCVIGGGRGVDATQLPWRDQGVLNLANSPYAKLHSVPVRAVTIEEGFWSKRRETNVKSSIPTMRDQLLEHGRMDNFRRLVGKSSEPQKGPVYSDSDIYKWVEAVGFALQSGDLPDVHNQTAAMIKEVVAVQEPSGYINTYYVQDRAELRMLQKTQRDGHELYCLGHMLQGAIAYYRATGDTTLLDAGAKMVDDFLIPNYGPGPDKKPIVAGHPEIEMSLIELYRTTGRTQYVDLAGYILHGDDRFKFEPSRIVYMYCGIPFTSRTKLEGHAVRAMYACCGATDYYLETGDQTYWKTLTTLWEDLSQRQMYITGGVGARSDGESFGEAYELPNAQAYGESCAAIGNMMWNWRMLAASGEAKHADVIERALYNGINSGMSLDGTTYCYRNPLAFNPDSGEQIRNPWYDTTCCPPNLERTFASLPGYFYSTSKDGLYVHLYDNSQLDWHLEDGTGLKVAQKTNYPWDGATDIAVTPAKATDFTFYLRVPGWSDGTQVSVNGKPVSGATPGQYLALRRRWAAGDVINVKFGMTPHVIEANPRVVDDYGRAAVQRGPLVYCLEQLDQPDGVQLFDVSLEVRQKGASAFHEEFRRDLLGGIVVLKHTGAVIEKSGSHSALYGAYRAEASEGRQVQLNFIPYYAWANRAGTPMQVWTPVLKA